MEKEKVKRKGFRSTLTVFAFVIVLPVTGWGMSYAVKDTLSKGMGQFVYKQYEPLADKPITVYYYKPEDLPDDAPIVILMHGNSRAAESYRESMAAQAKHYKFLLIVPKFSEKYYPNSRDYHQGGVFEKGGRMKEKKNRTFSVIEPLFDYVKKITNKDNEGYILYGFSAGSQFVHRYTWFRPDNRAIKTITASAGSYTMPDYEVDYKYGLDKTEIPEGNLTKAFAKDYTVMVGDADTVMSRKDLPKSSQVGKQGRDRVERAMNFYLNAKQEANKRGVPFNWKFVMVPNVGHSQSKIAEPVAKKIFKKNDKD